MGEILSFRAEDALFWISAFVYIRWVGRSSHIQQKMRHLEVMLLGIRDPRARTPDRIPGSPALRQFPRDSAEEPTQASTTRRVRSVLSQRVTTLPASRSALTCTAPRAAAQVSASPDSYFVFCASVSGHMHTQQTSILESTL